MIIFINGEPEKSPNCTIADLLATKGLALDSLVVELNRNIIKQDQWPAIRLKENDRLELLNFVGGG